MSGTLPAGELLAATPPHNLRAERDYLGAAMLLGVRPAADLAAADFHGEAHRLIYSTLLALGDVVDVPLLVARLRDTRADDGRMALNAVGGESYLAELVGGVPPIGAALAEHAERWASLIRETAAKRRLIDVACEALRAAHNGRAAHLSAGRLMEHLSAIGSGSGTAAASRGECSPVLTRMADVEPVATRWLWLGRMPLGRITLLVGRPGEGKSFLTADMAARISTGTPWPDGSECQRGSIIMLAAEDDPADTIRPRLDAHHADVSRVHLLSAVRAVDSGGKAREHVITLADVDAIAAALEQVGDCRLIVVDPIGSYLGGRTDAHRDNEVRAVLAPLAALAARHDAAVLVVAHKRKGAGVIADDLAMGSRAFTGIARAAWHLSRDPRDKHRRLLLPGKNNLAPEGTGLAFTILGEPARISWERDAILLTADEGLARELAAQRPPGPEADERQAAEQFLRDALADGPRPAKELEADAREGHGIAPRTLRRARMTLRVASYQPTIPGPWWWRLPDADAEIPE